MNSLAHFTLANSTPATESDSTRKAKRRSLLPQFSRKVSNDATNQQPIVEEYEQPEHEGKESSRRSGSETSRISTHSIDVEPENGRRRALDEDRRTMPPPSSKLSRPMSMIPPRGASISKIGRGHSTSLSKDKEMDVESARADSLAALTGASSKAATDIPSSQVSGLRRTGSTRLPQSPRPAAPSIPSRTTSTRPGEVPSRAASTTNHTRGSSSTNNGTTIAEKRSSTAKPRPQSIVRPPSEQDSVSSQTSPPRSSLLSRGRPGSHLPPAKPAFNTFQQHYSPVKKTVPKPPVPSSKTVRPTTLSEEDAPMSFDTAKQQIELLQLSLLHQASARCSADHTASAKRKLGRKHTKLRKEYENIRATELVHQRALNLAALETWCADPAMLVENLQILSLVYSDLESLTEEGSRHAEVVKMFEGWVDESQDTAKADFVQALPDDWYQAHSSLALKLRAIQRNLSVLRPPAVSKDREDEATALEMVLKGCKTLVDGILKELDMMSKLEKAILAKERTRVEDEVRMLVLDDVGMAHTPAWVPAWGKVL